MKKRVLSLFMALALSFSMTPTVAFAEEAGAVTEQEAQSGEGTADVYSSGEDAIGNDFGDDTTVGNITGDVSGGDVSGGDAGQNAAVQAAQALIDALPESITAENADELQAQLIAIGKAMEALDEAQLAKLNMARYENICAVLATFVAVQDSGTTHVNHTICGATTCEGHNDGNPTHKVVEEWIPLSWDENAGLLKNGVSLGSNDGYGYELETGNYYLAGNLTLDAAIVINGEVSLCLNGHSITRSTTASAIRIPTGEKFILSLCDCANNENGYITAGASDGVFLGKSTFNMYGGIIKDCGTVGVNAWGTFNMYGGTITTNKGGVVVGGNGFGGTFNMYGGKITDNTQNGVCINTESKFNMYDGEISGNKATNGGGVYINCANGRYAGTEFTMSGGKISGNKATNGGGVYVHGDSVTKPKFNMSGGEISGNEADNGGGVYVWSYVDFTMSGGEIKGNNTNDSSKPNGNVYVNTAPFYVSGTAKIHDNWINGEKKETGVYDAGSAGSAGNVYIYPNILAYDYIIIAEGLTEDASIGVTTKDKPSDGTPVQFATGASSDLNYTKIFKSDATDTTGTPYDVYENGGNLYLRLHEHSWNFEKSSTQSIRAVCGVDKFEGGSVTIVAPVGSRIYDGKEKAATLSNSLPNGVKAPEISYTMGSGENNNLPAGSAPTNAGDYTASITLTGVDGKSATASVTYEIQKAAPKADDFIFTPPSGLTYDGTAKTATVQAKNNGMGNVTMKYYQDEKEVEEPTDAGTYTVKISVEAGDNYTAADILESNEWTFTIGRNANVPSVELSGDMIYTGSQIKPAVTVTIGSNTLVEDRDYTVEYGTNTEAGTDKGTVTIKAAGNYAFEAVTEKFTIKRAEQKLSFARENVKDMTYSDRGRSVDNQLTQTTGNGTITYSSSNSAVARVNENTGEVTIVDVGETTITAKAAETANYEAGTATYKLTVGKALLLVNGVPVAKDKTYDGTGNADIEVSFVDGNNALVSLTRDQDYTVTGTFRSQNASDSEQTVDVEITLIGKCADRYTLKTDKYEVYAKINPMPISIGSATAEKRSYKPGDTSVTIMSVSFLDENKMPYTKITNGLDYYVTGKMADADAGNGKEVTVTVNLVNGNYLLADNTTTTKVDISKAATTVEEIKENYKYTLTGEKTVNIADFVIADLVASATSYTFDMLTGETGIFAVGPYVDDKGVVKYTLNGTGKVDDTVILQVKITSTNYEDVIVKIVITLKEKDDQADLNITGGNTVVFGETLKLGTNGGSGTGAVTYSIDKDKSTGDATIDADGVLTPLKVGSVFVKATKAGDDDYYEISSELVEVTITQAATTGEPKYTRITTDGKTLADAGLTLDGSTLRPAAGTLEWVDDAGKVLPGDTKVEVNTEYTWRFTPAGGNHKTLTGKVELYHVDAPVISAQPVNASVKVGEKAVFEVAATGTDLKYQWKINRNDGNGFVNIKNADSASYTSGVTDTDCNGFQYYCVISNAAGSVTTDTVTLTVTVQYDILDGADSSWTENKDGSLAIRGSGAIDKFLRVLVDGKEIASDNYTVTEGSTIITLKAAYLKTLPEGSHSFEIVWTDGTASTNFTVARNTSGNNGGNNNGNNNSNNSNNAGSNNVGSNNAGSSANTTDTTIKAPKTGDTSNDALWVVLLAVASVAGAAEVFAIRRKRNCK